MKKRTAEELYLALARLGSCYELNISGNTLELLNTINTDFSDCWRPYNPRKGEINRHGISITSLDGGFSGVPDLDSIAEYNKLNNTRVTETEIRTKTSLYPHCEKWLAPFANVMGRTHVIKLDPGAYFPVHRDNVSPDIDSFRIFIPLENCNYPNLFFMMKREVLQFTHGKVYFLDTCYEHTVFNASYSSPSTFIVGNIDLNEEAVRAVVKNVSAR
jgi:hypothetical protein